jgi:L-aminopeptidase/D-esterase-like protein
VSAVTATGFAVGAIAVVNAVGSAVIADGPHFWGAACEVGAEFGGLGLPAHLPREALKLRMKGAVPSTTVALVVTDAALTKPQAKRLALMADDGLARALRPVHAPMDGDTVFAVATLQKPMRDEALELTDIATTAADCLTRAVARGVFEATALPFSGALPAWKDRFAGLVAAGATP